MTGPLHGVRIIEAGGVGPGPFAAMLLGDLGADVLRIETPQHVAAGTRTGLPVDLLYRSRRSVAIDLKHPRGLEAMLGLIARADGLIEGFRPGVTERLGYGPEACAAVNPRLVYGRMTGWGQTGPMADGAGHDINYIALAGVLAHMPRVNGVPRPPLNLVGDFGGGGMLLGFGMVCALFEATRSGLGQVVDAAMIDGSALMMTLAYSMIASGVWSDVPGANSLEGNAPWYSVYETADGGFVSVGASEPQFWHLLLDRLGLSELKAEDRSDTTRWPLWHGQIAAVFATQTREEWMRRLENTDVCFGPVLTMHEAPEHPHIRERATFVEVDGVTQPAPAPRFSRSTTDLPTSPPPPGRDTRSALIDWGLDAGEVDELLAVGALVSR